jgi:Cu/Ag efflux protein CusF
MKKIVLFTLILLFTLGAFRAFAADTDPKNAKDNPAIPGKKENRLSDEEISHLTKRVEEIRDMDKTNMTVKEKREMRKELKEIKENVKRGGGIYIGVGTLLLIIIIILLV